MKTTILNQLRRAFWPAQRARWAPAAVAAAGVLASTPLLAGPTVSTLTGGPSAISPLYYGFVDGETKTVAQFHTPLGLALDSTGEFLYVADRDNNALRVVDLLGGQTFTLATAGLNKPLAVVLDSQDNAYVLNFGNGLNGTIVQYDYYGNVVATLATGLTNAHGLAMDSGGAMYVTVRTNTLLKINPDLTKVTVATVTGAGAMLQQIVLMDDGNIAACDSGRHGILLINPNTGSVSNFTGFNGVGDYTGVDNRGATRTTAKFNQPYGLAKAGNGFLIVSDYGNNRVKVVNGSGTVTNLYGVSSSLWYYGPGATPGWYDGTVVVPDAVGDVEARGPAAVLLAGNGEIYATEVYYHLIRKVSGANVPPLPPPPPPPPPVPAPAIGWVDFTVPPAVVVSVLRTDQPFIFNNDVTVAIAGTPGTETHYTYGATGSSIPNPGPNSGSTPPPYHDGMYPSEVPPSIVPTQPDLTVKAIGSAPGRQSSYVVSARFQFKVASPAITGDNAASFVVSDLTSGAQMFYTLDGSDPTNGAPSIGPVTGQTALSLNGTTNITFKIRAFRANYQASDIVTKFFTPSSFQPTSISFGFDSGEASSDFVASPGQTFYAPVTLSLVPGSTMYSLQFNVTVTNAGPNPGPAVAPGAFIFQSMLMKPDPMNVGAYLVIPPYMFLTAGTNAQPDPPPGSVVHLYSGGWFQDLTFTNSSLNLLGVGWLERQGKDNLYPTISQDLITYSMAHDTMFHKADNKVILGGYAFQVPASASDAQTYRIQLDRPSATSDGIGKPGAAVYIATPTNGSLAGGAINSIKIVTTGQRKYVVGDAAPLRWFNAGDFGNFNLDNSDVMQVFQSAIYSVNYPPFGSDFFDAMDSCGGTYQDLGNGYLQFNSFLSGSAQVDPLFDGNDLNINQIAFGDGILDVCDVYVTFRRSLDPSLTWFRRFWTNGFRAAELAPNGPPPGPAPVNYRPKNLSTNPPSIQFASSDYAASPGQTLQIPITARVFGTYPARVVMLNVTVEPLDGSPALTVPVQFVPGAALGTPTMSESAGPANYAATWLNSSIGGLKGTALVGTLSVHVPDNANSMSAYAVHFDHASASPNGLAALPKQTFTGLITLSPRTSSFYGDGIPDSWRLRYFGTVYNALSQAGADADGDGANNLQEYVAGTDPIDKASCLRVLTNPKAAVQASDCVVHWPSVAGKQYIIERSSRVFGATWSPVSTNTGTGTDMEFHDTNGGGVRFYRVRVQ